MSSPASTPYAGPRHSPGSSDNDRRLRALFDDEHWWLRAALLLVLLLYVRAVTFAPVYDDNLIGDGVGAWREVPRYFSQDIFGRADGTAHSVYYRPLSQTYGFLVCKLTGGAPGWQHLSAILLHLGVMLLAYALGRRLLGEARWALLAALLFALHPSKIESVAWIGSSYVDALSGAIFFAAILAFFKWHQDGGERWLLAALALTGGALLTKETMVSLPLVLGIYLVLQSPRRWPRWLAKVATGESRWRRCGCAVATMLPFAAVWAAYMAIRHRVIKPAGAAVEYIHPTYTLDYLWNAPRAVIWYLRHLVFPSRLAVEYSWPVVASPTLTNFVLPALAILAALACALWLCRKSNKALMLLAWFALTLAPPVFVAPMVSVHDRYLYMASYPFCVFVAWAALHLPGRRWLVAGLLTLLLASSWHELQYWDCDRTLWARVTQISPTHVKARVQTASMLVEEGQTAAALAVLDEGLRLVPDSSGLWTTRGDVLFAAQRWPEAQQAYGQVLRRTEPNRAQPVTGSRLQARAIAAFQLAKIEFAARDFAAAETHVRLAIALNSDRAGLHALLARILRAQGQRDAARAEDQREIQFWQAKLRARLQSAS